MSDSGLDNFDQSDYYKQLKSDCIKNNELFVDKEFPAADSSLGSMTSRDIDLSQVIWRRPKDIVKNPEFVVGDISRFDAVQGDSLANCWFISATASLAVTNLKLLERCVPFKQSFSDQYAGIFYFHFWSFDTWTEIIIDDLLPTVNGKLIFAKNSDQPNEFWVPLFEKAYAKLKGSYSSLDGGQTTYALVDFTGGVTERIDLREKRWSGKDELFNLIRAVISKSSMLGCEISSQPGSFEAQMKNGLYRSHAYAITNLVPVVDKSGKEIRLIRIRNPWAEGEWTGRWSDKSRDWMTLSDDTKKTLEKEERDEGEFWMSWQDWLDNFEWLTICHIQPDEFTQEQEHDEDHHVWREQKYHSEWIKGFNAGGSPSTYNSRFWSNPQFEFKIDAGATHHSHKSSTNKSSANKTTTNQGADIIVSLMQKSLSWEMQRIISFKIYSIKEGAGGILTADNYDKSALTLAGDGPQPASLREVSGHFCMAPGRYVIIPYTLSTGEEAQFLLRIFSETELISTELDVVTDIKGPEKKLDDDVQKVFVSVARQDTTLDAFELTLALNTLLHQRRAGTEDLISVEISRVLISRYAKSKPCLIILDELRVLYTDLTQWIDKFDTFDKDKSGDVDTYELDPLLRAIDVQISRQVQLSVVRRYGGKKNRLKKQDFIHCCCRLVTLNDYFMRQSSGGRNGKLQVDMDEWLAASILL